MLVMTPRPAIATFQIAVVSGDGHPVSGIDVCASFRSPGSTWSVEATTDLDGKARFSLARPELPVTARFEAMGEVLDLDAAAGRCAVLEL